VEENKHRSINNSLACIFLFSKDMWKKRRERKREIEREGGVGWG
jgi:hypothetical protein